MSRFNFNPEAHDAIVRADADPEQAAEVLRIAAGYLRRREPMPDHLADWLADAFESAAAKPAEHRPLALALDLGLAALNRRPATDWVAVGMYVDNLVDDGASQSEAARAASDAFDISESTAVRYLKQYRAAVEKHNRID